MPIKKRGKSAPSTKRKFYRPKRNKDDAPSKGFKKRKPDSEKLIYTSAEGILIVKTPASCTSWPNDLRLRLVRDYMSPKTLVREDAYIDKFVTNGFQDNIYKAGNHRVQVRQPAEKIEGSPYVAVLRTEVCDLDRSECMYLYHDDPAMRILMTWAFLNQKEIPGMPKLDIYPMQTE
jgi:hypothetical protein